MKKKVKQILSALLVAVMLVGFAPVGELTGLDLDRLGFSTKSSALEASGQCGENVYYTFDESTGLLTVSGEGEMRVRCFDGNSEIKTVVVEDGVTSIGIGAFYRCTGLTSITIPDSVTSIGSGAFEDCTGLTSITIPDSVTSIGWIAFSGCTGLTSITIPKSITSISGYAFEGCTGLTSVVIPNSVTSIEEWTFQGCTGLTSMVIPDSVTSIGHCAFMDCTGLTSVVIPDSVTSIGYCAFEDCTGLTIITIPDGVTSIDYGAFIGCASLKSINVSKNNKVYDSRNNCNAIIKTENNELISGCQTTIILDNVTSIGNSAFEKCTGLTNITIPNSVISIGSSAFEECTELTSVTIPNKITNIEDGVFSGCAGLTNVTIPDGVTNISEGAFSGCTSLTDIVIPDGVVKIGPFAFDSCSKLANINLPNNLTSIGSCAFSGTAYYDNNSNWENDILYIEKYLIDARDDLEGLCTIKNGSKLISDYAFSNCKKLTDIEIPNSVKNIGEYAFYYCEGLKKVIIPNGVTTISTGTFYGCKKLSDITIPNSVIGIDCAAFLSCEDLKKIIIPDSVTYISGDPFSGGAFMNCTGLTSIVIPDSVIRIESSAFEGCTGLTSVIIPNSVTSIGYYAFENCNGLTNVTIPESVTKIDKLAFGYYVDYDNDSLNKVSNFKIYCYADTAGEKYAIDNDFEYELLDKPHTHTLNHITVPSTCKVAGMEYDICSECGETFNEKTLPLAAHTWSEWTVVKEATTTAEGQEKRTCSVCDKVETRAIEKLKVIKDDKTGIEINYNDEYDSDTEIKVEEQFSGKSFQLINTEFGKVNSKIYDIATYKDGVKVQPNGEITVKVPLPDGFTTNKVFVCYVDSVSGKVTKIPCEVKDGYVIFKTNHFSEYAIVEQSANVKSVSVSDITLNYKKSTTIKPTIKADEGAKYKVEYSTSNAKVATVDNNGKVYAAKKGSATITCTVTDSNGNTVQGTCKVTVKYSFGQWLIKILLFGWIWY